MILVDTSVWIDYLPISGMKHLPNVLTKPATNTQVKSLRL
jgi:hypothetical protein